MSCSIFMLYSWEPGGKEPAVVSLQSSCLGLLMTVIHGTVICVMGRWPHSFSVLTDMSFWKGSGSRLLLFQEICDMCFYNLTWSSQMLSEFQYCLEWLAVISGTKSEFSARVMVLLEWSIVPLWSDWNHDKAFFPLQLLWSNKPDRLFNGSGEPHAA